jgi:hypothetical protein
MTGCGQNSGYECLRALIELLAIASEILVSRIAGNEWRRTLLSVGAGTKSLR